MPCSTCKKSFDEEQENDELWARGEVPGMNSKLWRERWQLANSEWKFDIIPEIIDGKTIFDFVDPDIEKMLEELEREEGERVQTLEDEEAMKSSESEIDEDTMEIIHKIRKKKGLLKIQRRSGVTLDNDENLGHKVASAKKGKTLDKLESHLTDMGLSEEQVEDTIGRVRSRSRSQSRVGRKRSRSVSTSKPREEEEGLSDKKKAKRAKSRERSVSNTPKPGAGYRNVQEVEKAAKIYKRLLVARGTQAKKGEADRSIPNLMPRHLNSGKMGLGTRSSR